MMGEENKETTKNIQNECGWNKMFKKNVQERRNERQKNQRKKKTNKKAQKEIVCVCVFFLFHWIYPSICILNQTSISKA